MSYTKDMESIFSKIIRGEVPAHYVFEDSFCVAILDIHPIQRGHTLVIPREPMEQFTQMDSGEFTKLMNVSHMLAKKLQEHTKAHRITLRIEGFDVNHVHVHLIPCNNEHDSYKAGREDIEPDHTTLAAYAAELKPIFS
jgi:histidine triad (HIT) family protein